ncbi:hypothetical protein GCM10010160_23900 [Acrocarpospora corrugata]
MLHNLTDGMDAFFSDPQQGWHRTHAVGPAVLGCVPWFDDDQLLDRIDQFQASCILITKPDAATQRRDSFDRLKERATTGPGFPAEAFYQLEELASRYDGPPEPIHPASQMHTVHLQTFRSLGFRKAGRTPVPLIHAKMFLIGRV